MDEHVHLNCENLLGSLSEYLDGALSPELCQEIEKHLAGCENCRVVLNTTRRTIDLVQATAEKADVPDDVRSRLFKRLDLDHYVPARSV
jgi:anti-sigma factor (TIGR02949 family)